MRQAKFLLAVHHVSTVCTLKIRYLDYVVKNIFVICSIYCFGLSIEKGSIAPPKVVTIVLHEENIQRLENLWRNAPNEWQLRKEQSAQKF